MRDYSRNLLCSGMGFFFIIDLYDMLLKHIKTYHIRITQVGLLPLHDASHAAITHNPYVWKILGASHDFLNGASFINWIYQHMLGHHPYTNVAGADPDITTGDPDVRRIKPSQRYFSHYVGQQYFVPLLYIGRC